LVQYFQEALAGRGKVLAADASAEASALQEADEAIELPRVEDPAYADTLIEVCRANAVRLLVSLNDFELSVLASHRSRFAEVDTLAVVSSPEVLALCADKWEHATWLQERSIATPRSWLTVEAARSDATAGTSLIVKPRWGSGSFSLERTGLADLNLALQLVQARVSQIPATFQPPNSTRTVIIQEVVRGREYGLDIVNDLDGKYVTTFVKRKLAMRSGETDRATVVRHPRLEKLGETIGTSLRHVGNLDCDVIENDAGLHVLDLNPRFGGGYPFSHLAGANLPAAIIAWAEGETPDPAWLRVSPGIAAAKCDRLVPLRAASA
ncbi:MAG: ATP-grasp domain-containing protein, partial [Gemmataceae bacterium]